MYKLSSSSTSPHVSESKDNGPKPMAEFERKSAIARLTARVPTLTNFADPTIWARANLDILCSLNSALADLYGLGLVLQSQI